ELEVLLVHLRAWRVGSVVDRKQSDALQLGPLRLEAHHVRGDTQCLDLLRHIVDFELHRGCSRRGHAVVSHALMNGAHQVRAAGVVELEAEVAFGVSLGAASLFHALGKAEQHDIVARGGLVRSAVLDPAGEGFRRDQGGEKQEYKKCNRPMDARLARYCDPAPAGSLAVTRPDPSRAKRGLVQDDTAGKFQTLAPFLSRNEEGAGEAACSSRAISARMAAASSSSEDFSDW